MQTSCPECGTTFRVSQDQLGLRRGLVRCGSCNAVFNAYDTLLPELESAPPHASLEEAPGMPDMGEVAASMPTPTVHPPDAVESIAGDDTAVSTGVWAEVQSELELPSDLPDVPPRDALAAYQETAAVQSPSDEDDGLVLARGPDGTVTAATSSAPDSPDAILLSELPNRQADRTGLPKWKTALYAFLILTLSATLLGQLAFFLRGELAAAIPETRPLLTALCRPLDCVVPMPRQLTRQAIVSSSLEHDAEQKSRVRLTFLLANRTNQTQTWPHILLTLSDVRESPVAQKALPPEDYLPRGISARSGFPPQSEQEARVELDIGNLAAASYLLNTAYP